jgi:hypothetical protein
MVECDLGKRVTEPCSGALNNSSCRRGVMFSFAALSIYARDFQNAYLSPPKVRRLGDAPKFQRIRQALRSLVVNTDRGRC